MKALLNIIVCIGLATWLNGQTISTQSDHASTAPLGSSHITAASTQSSRLEGVVLDSKGQPASGIRILRHPVQQPFREGDGGIITDSQGRFAMTLNTEGMRVKRMQYTLIATDANDAYAAAIRVDDDATNAILKLEPTWTWTGRVIDNKGAGISKVQVQLFFRGPQYNSPFQAPVSTTDDGSISIKGLPQGCSFRVNIIAAGYGRSGCMADAPDSGVTIVEAKPIQLMAADLPLGGVVLDENNQPAGNANVVMSGENQPGNHSMTDRAGRFQFTSASPRNVRVTASYPDGRFGSLITAGGETNVVLRLTKTPMQSGVSSLTKVTGTVLDTNGLPAANVRVAIIPANQGEERTDSSGRFSLNFYQTVMDVVLTEWVVIAYIPEQDLAASIDLRESAANIILRLQPSWSVAGRVINTDGLGISNSLVHLTFHTAQVGNSIGAPAQTDAEGRYQFRGLAWNRPYRLNFEARGYSRGKLTLNPPKDLTQFVEAAPFIMSDAKLVIAGQVLDDKGQPAKAINISCYRSHSNFQPESQTISDNSGKFLIKDIAPGSYDLVVYNLKDRFGGATANAGDTNIVIRLKSIVPDQKLGMTRTISGSVLDATGKPVPHIGLFVYSDNPDNQGVKRTDPEGRFTLTLRSSPLLQAMGQTVVTATDPIRNLAASLEFDANVTHVNLTLAPAWIFSGHVTKGDKGIANAEINLLFRNEQFVGPFGSPVITDTEGRFEIRGLPHNRSFMANISAGGFVSSRLSVDSQNAKTNRLDIAPIRLIAADQMIGGLVLNEKDEPEKGAWISCSGTDSSSGLQYRSDSEGRFIIKGLGPGPVRVRASDSNRNGNSPIVVAEAGNTNITLRIRQFDK